MFFVEYLFFLKIYFRRGSFPADHLTMTASDILMGVFGVESDIIKILTTVLKFYNFT